MEVMPVNIELNSDEESEGEQITANETKSRRRVKHNRTTSQSTKDDSSDDSSSVSSSSEDEFLYKNPPWTSVWSQYNGVTSPELDSGSINEAKDTDLESSESADDFYNDKDTETNLHAEQPGSSMSEQKQALHPDEMTPANEVDSGRNEELQNLPRYENVMLKVEDLEILSNDNYQMPVEIQKYNMGYDPALADVGPCHPGLEFVMSDDPCSSPVPEFGSMVNAVSPCSEFSDPVSNFMSSIMNNDNGFASNEQQGNNISVFPTLHISQAGLISVFLRQEVVVEMTVDRTIRVIDHIHKTVVATSNQGDMSCLNHTAARLYNQRTSIEADIFWERHAKISPSGITFACGKGCFFLHPHGLVDVPPNFMDLSNDTSVTLLFASSTYGPHILPQLEDIVKQATYNYNPDGSFEVFINDIKIEQMSNNDVIVEHGQKSLYVSPVNHTAHVGTPFSELSVEKDWTIKLKRNVFQMVASIHSMILSDGDRECGFNAQGQVFVRPAFSVTETIIKDGISVDLLPVPPHPPPPLPPYMLPPPSLGQPPHLQSEPDGWGKNNSNKTSCSSLQEIIRRQDESEEDYFERLKTYKSGSSSKSRAITGGCGNGDCLTSQ